MPPATTLLLLLLFTDVTFIVLHLVDVETGWMRGARMSLEADGGMPETYQYVKEFWMALCMGVTYWRTRAGAYAAWSAVFAFLLLDDAGQFHERAGTWLANEYGLPAIFGLRAKDTGELIVAAAAGLGMLTLVALTSWRHSKQPASMSRHVMTLMCALGVLGVVVDMLHVVTYLNGSLLAQVLLVVEDGGEMIVMSALTAYAFHVTTHQAQSPVELLRKAAQPAAWTGPVEAPPLKRAS